MNILSTQLLTKNYGKLRALNQVSLDIPKGSIFGLLGPNGSGKTTFLGMVLNVLKSDEGTFTWFENKNADEARKNIGALLETPNFYHYLNAVENLRIVAKIKNFSEDTIDDVLKVVNLYERRFSEFKTFSLGMKQRLAIASALLTNPPVLVFDEPTNGLDPEGVADIRNLIINLQKQGKTIILASHLLYEVELVCTHVAIIKKGNLLAKGPVNEVLSEKDTIEISCDDLEGLVITLNTISGVSKITQIGKNISFISETFDAKQINKTLAEKGIWINHIQTKKASLEEKFIELTQQKN